MHARSTIFPYVSMWRCRVPNSSQLLRPKLRLPRLSTWRISQLHIDSSAIPDCAPNSTAMASAAMTAPSRIRQGSCVVHQTCERQASVRLGEVATATQWTAGSRTGMRSCGQRRAFSRHSCVNGSEADGPANTATAVGMHMVRQSYAENKLRG